MLQQVHQIVHWHHRVSAIGLGAACSSRSCRVRKTLCFSTPQSCMMRGSTSASTSPRLQCPGHTAPGCLPSMLLLPTIESPTAQAQSALMQSHPFCITPPQSVHHSFRSLPSTYTTHSMAHS